MSFPARRGSPVRPWQPVRPSEPASHDSRCDLSSRLLQRHHVEPGHRQQGRTQRLRQERSRLGKHSLRSGRRSPSLLNGAGEEPPPHDANGPRGHRNQPEEADDIGQDPGGRRPPGWSVDLAQSPAHRCSPDCTWTGVRSRDPQGSCGFDPHPRHHDHARVFRARHPGIAMYYIVDSTKPFEEASTDVQTTVARHGFGVLHGARHRGDAARQRRRVRGAVPHLRGVQPGTGVEGARRGHAPEHGAALPPDGPQPSCSASTHASGICQTRKQPKFSHVGVDGSPAPLNACVSTSL